MNRVGIVCLIGIPASGKTTISNEIKSLLENHVEHCFDVQLVCFDNFEGFNNAKGNWKSKRKEVYEKVEEIIHSAKTKIKTDEKTVVILDDNMYYRSMRYEYAKLAKMESIGYCQIYLETDLNKAAAINSKRIDPVPYDIIDKMFKKIEVPNPDKFNWELKSVTINSFCNFQDASCLILDLILSSIQYPLKSYSNINEAIIEKPCNNAIHIADIALRRIISYKIQCFRSEDNCKNEIKKFSSSLCIEKQDLFNAFKSGLLLIPGNADLELSQEEKINIYYDFFSYFLL